MAGKKTLFGIIVGASLLLQGCEDEQITKCKQSAEDSHKKSLAFSYCEQAAKQGDAEGQALFGKLLLEQGKTQQAVEYLEKSANQLNPQALFSLGELYEKGTGVEKDANKATFYYRYSCEQKSVKGCERESILKEKAAQKAKDSEEQKAFETYKQAEERRLAQEKQALEQQKLDAEKQKLAQQRAELEKQKLALDKQAKEMEENIRTEPDPNGFFNDLAKFQDKQNGLWGFVDRNGNVVIRPQFAYAGRFSQGRSAVQSPSTKLWGFIDTRGQYVIFPHYCMLGAFSESDGLAGVYQNGRLENGKCVGGKWGFMDTAGNWVINPILDHAERFIKGKAKITYQGRTGFINRNGQWVE